MAGGACSGDEPKRGQAAPPTTAGTPTTNVEALNRQQIERFVLDTQRAGNPDLKAGNPSCPDSIPLVVGASFECTVEVEGVKASYLVSLPSLGVIQANPVRAIISTAAAVAYVRSNLPQDLRGVVVDCGPAPVQIVEVGGAFPCAISDGSSTQTVQVVAHDNKGTVSVRP